MRRLAGLAFVVSVATWSCTTFVEPTTCKLGSTACGGIHDSRFCEYLTVDVEGADCAALNLAPSKLFCVVTSQCIDTNYAVKNRDCKVLRYSRVRDNYRDECPEGAPTFINR
jgi:hypothetical protein